MIPEFCRGASQLVQHDFIKPSSILADDILNQFGAEYMYLSSVMFVKEVLYFLGAHFAERVTTSHKLPQVKKGHLSETSPMLNDISGVLNWEKVNSGLLKMYKVSIFCRFEFVPPILNLACSRQAECLAKFPVMQHFLFGSILNLR